MLKDLTLYKIEIRHALYNNFLYKKLKERVARVSFVQKDLTIDKRRILTDRIDVK